MRSNNLIIFGCGHLGARVGQQWLASFSGSTVFAVTRSTDRFTALQTVGMTPILDLAEMPLCDHVLVSVPSSGQSEHLLRTAAAVWSGKGCLLLISTTRIFKENKNQLVDESSAIDLNGGLARAENFILQKGGTVLRLAGLYDDQRGPHHVYLKSNSASGPENGYLNLLHYDDAAALSVAALRRGESKGIYMGCDGEPLRRSEFADILFRASGQPNRPRTFTFAASDQLGKRCDGRQTEKILEWQPRWTFRSWIMRNAR